MKKLNIALLTGGDSSEWQIALNGAKNVASALDPERYTPYTIVVRGGEWLYRDEAEESYPLDLNTFSLQIGGEHIQLEYALILIHGTPGEDGRLQGMLDILRIPYSSCDMVSSVLTFDKSACKRALIHTNIPLAKEVLVSKGEQVDTTQIISELGLPLFAKPNASGSSFGVTKVKQEADLLPAIESALTEGDQVLLEEFIEGREVSCGVMIAGGKEYIFPITELVCETEFFDYQAKYEGLSKEITPADLSEGIVKELNRLTINAYKALRCRGVVRIDFIIKEQTPYLIEINTIPGMSAQSIIPQQCEAMGMSTTELYNLIIEETR